MNTEKNEYAAAETQFITAANGIQYAYRRIGAKAEIPLIYFNHLTANLDNCDPRVMDGLATQHEVIAFDYRGVGATSGDNATTIKAMASDCIQFIKALGYTQVDILGFSLGGFVAQELLAMESNLVRKVILAGTGPRGGDGISSVAKLTYWDVLRGFATFVDPKYYLFFTPTASGRVAAKAFLHRLKERRVKRDAPATIKTLQAQLKAITAWGKEQAMDLSAFTLPVLVVNGDKDRMVPTPNTYDMAKRFPNATLHIYDEAGHGAIFQHHHDFVKRALAFYAAN